MRFLVPTGLFLCLSASAQAPAPGTIPAEAYRQAWALTKVGQALNQMAEPLSVRIHSLSPGEMVQYDPDTKQVWISRSLADQWLGERSLVGALSDPNLIRQFALETAPVAARAAVLQIEAARETRSIGKPLPLFREKLVYSEIVAAVLMKELMLASPDFRDLVENGRSPISSYYRHRNVLMEKGVEEFKKDIRDRNPAVPSLNQVLYDPGQRAFISDRYERFYRNIAPTWNQFNEK